MFGLRRSTHQEGTLPSVLFLHIASMTHGRETYSYDFNAVVIDHELKNDIAASAFRQRLNLNKDAGPEALAMELANLFRLSSERVQ